MSRSLVLVLSFLLMTMFAGDVCFEGLDKNCLAKGTSDKNVTRWRFNPKVNKCVQVQINPKKCQMRNLFHSENACNSVCPGEFILLVFRT